MLWLAIHLPRLAVEAVTARAPAATIERGRIAVADARAEAAGIVPGMRLSSALALAPALHACAADPGRQAAALERLACWAGHFSPQLSLAPPHELLLEIGGCLRLFGGADALLREVDAGCSALGHAHRLGLAPTPLAAQWLARADGVETPETTDAADAAGAAGVARTIAAVEAPATEGAVNAKGAAGAVNTGEASRGAAGQGGAARLRARLAALPVAVLGLPARQREGLAALGLDTLGQLLALPAAGLARRFGPELPLQLARALGEVPDPRPPFIFPERFAQALELPARVDQADRLLFAARRLLLALAGWLHARSAGLRACTLTLVHDEAPPSALVLGFATATRDAERLQRVLRERLERLVLAAPVVALRLAADAAEALPGRSAALFGAGGGEAIAPVLERLRARLGDDAVHGLALVADHRPECATRAVAWPGASASLPPAAPRPLGLLPAPRALAERGGRPWHNGPLRLLTRAERIESGWWDGGEGHGDLRRDYFVALSAHGEWLWIFRDAEGWWLHGLFA